MTDLYLKFTDEAEAISVLYTQEPTAWDEQGNVTATEPRQAYANISTIGIIYKDEQPLDGWHVNVRVVGEDATALEAFSVTPTLPVRVWG
jgi:hypothetical protein